MSITPTGGKLSRKTIDTIFNALKGAMAIKCEELLFDDFGISGRAIETNILIIQPMPDAFEFEALDIGRIPDLFSRLKLVIDDDTLTGSFEEFREGEVGKLIFKTKKTKVEFRCKAPKLIKTRKVFNDAIIMTFNLNADAIRFMTTGSSAMKNKSVTFKLTDEKIYLRLIDSEGDVLDHLVTDTVDIEPDFEDEEVSTAQCSP